jgi:hypothetical protein
MNSMLDNLKSILKKWKVQYTDSKSEESSVKLRGSMISHHSKKHEDLIDNLGTSSQKINKLKALSLA